MRFIGVVSRKKGSGADSAHIEMVKGDDAFGGGASEVKRRTLMMTMVGAPAISARACVRTVATVMPWVLAVALEAIWVRGETLFPFAQQRLGRSAWVDHSSLLQTIFSFTSIRWSLGGEDARDEARGRGWRTVQGEVRDEPSANGRMS